MIRETVQATLDKINMILELLKFLSLWHEYHHARILLCCYSLWAFILLGCVL